MKKIFRRFPAFRAKGAVRPIPAVAHRKPSSAPPPGTAIGLIAGNGSFPLLFAQTAQTAGCRVVAICHTGETDGAIEQQVEKAVWIKLGELGKIISVFKEHGVTKAVMAGGVNRVRLFGGVKLDLRGAALLARLRSTKDDVLMRGIAEELATEGIEVIDSTVFMNHFFVGEGLYTRQRPTTEEMMDVAIGVAALEAMSAQDIGQLVVVREGVVVAVEAVEGSDAAILRGGELGGKGTVVVKFAKPTQDMRFDVPIVGKRTIETMIKTGARVLALESGRCLLLDRDEVIALADRHSIAIIGCSPLRTAEGEPAPLRPSGDFSH